MRYRPTIYFGRLAGIELRLDVLVILLIGVLFLTSLNDASARNAAPGEVWSAVAHLVLLVVMLVCMFLHELGHALMARLRGHKPTMIMLSFVGLTFFEARKASPSDEFWIALSGPLVNIAIALALSPFLALALTEPTGPALFSLSGMASWKGFLAWLSILNIVVAAINLLPGWPADGARALRGWLARKHGYAAGTMRAVAISHGMWLVVAGVSVVTLSVLPRIQAMTNPNPARSPASLLVMYQAVALLFAAIGIYYGWLEVRRVRNLGEEVAAQDVGPPEVFKPGARKAAGVVQAEVVQTEPDLKARAGAAATAATVAWKAARATGKGTGWFLRKGAKAASGLLFGEKHKNDPPAS